MSVATEAGPQVSPVLTLHETSPGQYLLRLHKVSQNASLISLLMQQLPGIRQIIVVTPMDTKVFNVPNGTGDTRTIRIPGASTVDPHPIPNSNPVDLDESADANDDPMASAIAMAEEAERPPTDEAISPTARRRRTSASPPESPCGRCQGTGNVMVIVEGGSSAETGCPVCRGTGQSIKFGMNVRKGK